MGILQCRLARLTTQLLLTSAMKTTCSLQSVHTLALAVLTETGQMKSSSAVSLLIKTFILKIFILLFSIMMMQWSALM